MSDLTRGGVFGPRPDPDPELLALKTTREPQTAPDGPATVPVFEVEFDQLQAEVREELARSPELAEAQVPALGVSLREEMSTLAEVSPGMAVLAAYRRIEARLTEILDSADARSRNWVNGRKLAKFAGSAA